MDGSQATDKQPRATDVTILGKTYTVRSDADEDLAVSAADLVNGRMRDLLGRAGNVATEKVAVLAAMNLAGDLLRLRKESKDLRESLRSRAQRILKLIDAQL